MEEQYTPNSIKIVLELNCCIVHCALLHTQTAKHHGCNETVHCCMPRPQSIVFHIASMANTRMSLSHNRYLQCYLKIRYIHGALRSGYAAIRNAQCNNSEDNLFWIRCILLLSTYYQNSEILLNSNTTILCLKTWNQCLQCCQKTVLLSLWSLAPYPDSRFPVQVTNAQLQALRLENRHLRDATVNSQLSVRRHFK